MSGNKVSVIKADRVKIVTSRNAINKPTRGVVTSGTASDTATWWRHKQCAVTYYLESLNMMIRINIMRCWHNCCRYVSFINNNKEAVTGTRGFGSFRKGDIEGIASPLLKILVFALCTFQQWGVRTRTFWTTFFSVRICQNVGTYILEKRSS